MLTAKRAVRTKTWQVQREAKDDQTEDLGMARPNIEIEGTYIRDTFLVFFAHLEHNLLNTYRSESVSNKSRGEKRNTHL
jgi:hypothetical protein